MKPFGVVCAIGLVLVCPGVRADTTQDINTLKTQVSDLFHRLDVANWFLDNTRANVRSIFSRLDVDEFWINNSKNRVVGVEHREDTIENNVSSLQISLNALRDLVSYYKSNNPQANLLVNGDFSQPAIPFGGPLWMTLTNLPGWQIVYGNVDIMSAANCQPSPGAYQTLDLVGNTRTTTIRQTFPTNPGQMYTFSGYMSNGGSTADDVNMTDHGSANVFLNGALFVKLFTSANGKQTNMNWQPFSYSFIAALPSTTLTITDTTNEWQYSGIILGSLSVR